MDLSRSSAARRFAGVKRNHREKVSPPASNGRRTFVAARNGSGNSMTDWNTEELIAADKQFVWHPFTNMPEWCAPEHEPIVIVEGHGALLRDSRGREYIDGNSSIWTNIHGHNHPRINRAIHEQLERIAHSSFLGTTNPVAIELAREIVELFPCKTLSRVFYSDHGSTGIEAAQRIAAQFFQMRGEKRNLFVPFRSGYHGDTAGAAAVGAAKMVSVDHEVWRFPVRSVGSIEEVEKLTGGQAGARLRTQLYGQCTWLCGGPGEYRNVSRGKCPADFATEDPATWLPTAAIA